MSSLEFDVRLYAPDGTRKRLPMEWIVGGTFEIGERGGCLNGTLLVDVPWEDLALVGTEYVDIRLWGSEQVLYRGWVRTPQQDLATPEKATLQMIGLMELLNGWIVPRDFCYGTPVDLGVLFRDIINLYVNPNFSVEISTTGVLGTGATVQSMALNGKTVSQAFNAICDAAPGLLIWGADVDEDGLNRLYLHPRNTSVGYLFSVGGDVTYLTYPRDATQVVNRIRVTGGKADPALGYLPNLAPNASFEDCVAPSETGSNVLINPGFEAGTEVDSAGWTKIGDSTIDTPGRSGSYAATIDDNPDTPEGFYQDVAVAAAVRVSGAFWAMVPIGETWDIELTLAYYDVSNVLLDSEVLTVTPAADGAYHHYLLEWEDPSASGAAYVRYQIQTSVGSGAHGANIDDCAMWFPSLLGSQNWEVGGGSGGNFSQIDWGYAHPDYPPYDGGLMVRAVPALFGGGSPYAQIQVTTDGRPDGKANTAYLVTVHIQVPSGSANIEVGCETYQGSSLLAPHISSPATVADTDGWQTVQVAFTSEADTDKLRPFVRFLTNAVGVLVDAVGLYEGSAEPDLYYPEDTITALRSVVDYSGEVDADVLAGADAIEDGGWGLREAAVSQDSITTKELLDAFCPAYFNAHGRPNVQARLEIDGATSPVRLIGTVKILNLPSAPPALFPSNVRYEMGETIKVSVDLNNKRPDLAVLLRKMALGG